MQPYIDIDLGKSYKVNKIRLVSPTEARLKTYSIFVSSEKFPEKNKEGVSELPSNNVSADKYITPPTFSSSDSVAFFPPLEGRYFRIQLNGDAPQSLVLSGLEFFGACGGNDILRDPEDSKCENGGFETGDFQGWTGAVGQWNQPMGGAVNTIGNIIQGINPNNHRILRVPFVDEVGVPISMPCKGSYVAKLGNTQNREVEWLRYKFTVTQQNANFFFRYAFVQEDGMHTLPERNPYFRYKIIRVSDNTVWATRTIEFDPDNPSPFFQRHRNYFYRSWTCVNVDLSQFIDEEFIAEFENADCDRTGHHGYSYIDGLCTNAADSKPITRLTGSTKICNINDLIFSGANSYNANRAVWTVSQLHPFKGFVTQTCTREVFGQPGSVNIMDIFNACAIFDPTMPYEISLKVFSDCGEGTTETIKTQPVPSKIGYVDALICNGYTGEIKMKGITTCPECTYQWSPSFRFVDPYVDKPVLRPGQYIPCGTVVKVNATDVDGCIYSQEVKINTSDATIVSIDKDVDKTDLNNGSEIPKSVYCGYEVKINVRRQSCLSDIDFKVVITSEADPDFLKVADFESTNGNGEYVYKVIIPQNLGEDLQSASNKLKATLLFNSGNVPNNLNVLGNCDFNFPFTLENRFWYFGYWKNNVIAPGNYVKHGTPKPTIPFNDILTRPFIFPSLLASTSIGSLPSNDHIGIVTSTFHVPAQPNPISYGYGAFAVTAKIYSRWNEELKEHKQVALQPTITDHNRFRENQWSRIWDGTYQGNRVQQGIYLMTVSISNCRVTDKEALRTYIYQD